MSTVVEPLRGESWDRAVERHVFDRMSCAWGSARVQLRPPRSHGGDILATRPVDDAKLIVEVRSINADFGACPFFDGTRGLKAHRQLQRRIDADQIVMVGVAIEMPSGLVVAVGAMGGERFEARALRASRDYVAQNPDRRSTCIRPIWIDEMSDMADLLPGVSI